MYCHCNLCLLWRLPAAVGRSESEASAHYGRPSRQSQLLELERSCSVQVSPSRSNASHWPDFIKGGLLSFSGILTFSPFHRSGSRSGLIHHHDVRIADHHLATLRGHTQEVCGLTWSPDGRYLASGGNDNLVNIWSGMQAGRQMPLHSFGEHQGAVKVGVAHRNHVLDISQLFQYQKRFSDPLRAGVVFLFFFNLL